MPVKQLSDGNTDGVVIGQSATDLVGMYGKTPVAQRASSIQATTFLSVTTNATAAANLAVFVLEVANTLVNIGAWKGSA